jgi:FkbM family methyltransferase
MVVFQNEDVGRSLVQLGEFERGEVAFLRRVCRPDHICFDVGANIGYFTITLAKAACDGIVYSFEPIPVNARIVELNCALNDLENVKVIQQALSDREGDATFFWSTDSAFSSLLDTQRKNVRRQINVRCTTIDLFIRKVGVPRIDILKMDIEGAEGLALQGANELLASNHRPLVILMELFDANLHAFKTSRENILRDMNQLGYSAFTANRDGSVARVQALTPAGYNVFFVDEARIDVD